MIRRVDLKKAAIAGIAGAVAMELAAQGTPFRDAYRAAADPARWSERDPAGSLAARVSPGAPGAPRLDLLRERLAGLAPAPETTTPP